MEDSRQRQGRPAELREYQTKKLEAEAGRAKGKHDGGQEMEEEQADRANRELDGGYDARPVDGAEGVSDGKSEPEAGRQSQGQIR